MIEERALVLGFEGANAERVRVRTQRQSACNGCQLKNGCGQHALEKLGGDKSLEFSVNNDVPCKTGDVVIVGIPEEGLLSAALMMYLFPLLCMLLSASLLGEFFELSEAMSVVVGAIGLFAGFFIARRYAGARNSDPRFTPRLIRLALPSQTNMACRAD